MTKHAWQKFFIYFFAVLFAISPLVNVYAAFGNLAAEIPKAKAEDPSGGDGENSGNEPAADSSNGAIEGELGATADDAAAAGPSNPSKEQIVIASNLLLNATNDKKPNSVLTLEEKMGVLGTPRLVVMPSDMFALRAFAYLAMIKETPDFALDITELWNNLPATLPDGTAKPANEQALREIKYNNADLFNHLVSIAQEAWAKSPAKGFRFLDDDALAQILNKNVNELDGMTPARKAELLQAAADSFKMDSRVIKSLVYLLTPKNQGGAGHWRVRVRKIMQLAAAPLSTESDYTLQSTAKSTLGGGNGADCTGLNAADCGNKARQESAGADVTASDQNGDQTDYSTSGGSTGDRTVVSEDSALLERNISAHTTGQAFDVSELDDIRCTLVIIKHKRIGGSSTTAIQKPAKPIKLAWQSNDGYSQSGGNPVDMMGIMRQALTESFRDMIDGLGGDVSSYDGDLSQADLSDVVEIVGRSLFAQIINSPTHNLAGYDTADTMQKLGSMYFADYFGLPRELFLNRDINSLDEIEAIIGQAAVEKRLNIPFGSLSSFNEAATAANLSSTDENVRKQKVYNLEGSFLNVGQAKLEYEMGLSAGSLDGYVSLSEDQSPALDPDDFVGRRLIEQQLNIQKGAFAGDTYQDIRKNLTSLKADLIFSDPTYADNKLHVDPGTTQKLVSGSLSPTDYAKLIGKTRRDDTLYGLLHFAAEDSAYNLPSGMWEEAVKGSRKGVRTVGLYFISQLFSSAQSFSPLLDLSPEEQQQVKDGKLKITSDPENLGAEALRSWLISNTTKSGDTCKASEEVKIPVTYTLTKTLETLPATDRFFGGGTPSEETVTTETRTKEITLSEDKMITLGLEYGDLHNMFGCADSSSQWVFERVGSKLLNYAIANKMLNRGENVKIDLLDTDPELRTTNPEILFYVNRINTINDGLKKIKGDWNGESGAEFVAIKSQLDRVIGISSGGVDVTNPNSMSRMSRDLGPEVGKLKSMLQQRRDWLPAKMAKINTTITDINRVIVASAEILSGRVIKNADDLTLDQISYSSSLAGAGDGGANPSCGKAISTNGFNPTMLFGLFTREISPLELFTKIGSTQLETQLNLPVNSLYYLVQNYEKKGIHGVDAFYQAIGQARVEQEFCMPSFYFQGAEFGKNMPDFTADNNLLLLFALETINSSYSAYRFRVANTPSGASLVTLGQYLESVKTSNPPLFSYFVSRARTNWVESEKMKAKQAGMLVVEKNLNDVATNVKNSGFTDGIRTGEADILFRMGINASTFGAAVADPRAQTIMESVDKRLGLKAGSTLNLLKGKSVALAKGEDLLDTTEKSKVEAFLHITAEQLNTYLRLLNGDIKISDVNGVGIGPSYNYVNRYAEQPNNTSCPVVYRLSDPTAADGKGAFEVADTYMENDTFCISDKKGRHCFKNREEASRYQNSDLHQAEQYDNVVSLMGAKAAEINGHPEQADVYTNQLVNLINATGDFQLLSQEDITAIADPAGTGKPIIPEEYLKKLFWRTASDAPIQSYKAAVGKIEAKAILTSRIFASLGIDIDPSLFDSGSIYEILNGNFSSLFAVGARMLDNSMGVKPGTSMMIYYASNPANRACALAQAGATILGSFLGLQSVSVTGNVMNNIGQAKIEETLHLPRGSFRGETFYELENRVKPLTFALAFKIPLSGTGAITDAEMTSIMGSKWTAGDTSESYKVQALVSYLQGYYSQLTAAEAASLQAVEDRLTDTIYEIVQWYKAGNIADYVDIDAPKGKLYAEEVAAFRQMMVNMDSWFGIAPGTTSNLFMSNITPNNYIKLVGEKQFGVSALTYFAERMGLEEPAASAAASLVSGLNSVFHCSSESYRIDRSGKKIVTGCADPNYHNPGMMFGYLSQIFNVNIDNKAHVDPGTFQAILTNPSKAGPILLSQMPRILDAKLGLSPGDGVHSWTFTSLYNWFQKTAQPGQIEADTACNNTANLTLAGLNERKRNNDAVLTNPRSSDADKADANADNAAVALAVSNASETLNDCKIAARTDTTSYRFYNEDKNKYYTYQAYRWVQENVSWEIHKKLLNVNISGENVGIDMPIEDIRLMLFEGSLKYLEVAAIAITVNYFANDVGANQAVPGAMRITYADIKQAYFPDAAATKAARDAATWASLNNQAYNGSADVIGFGDTCPPDGSIFGSLFKCTPAVGGTAPLRDTGSIIGSNQIETAQRFSCFDSAGTNLCVGTDGDKYLRDLNTDAKAAEDLYDNTVRYGQPEGCPSRTAALGCDEKWTAWETDKTNRSKSANSKRALADDLDRAQKDAESQAQKAFRDALQYRLVDQMLWRSDKNIFPGFSRALIQGSWNVKKGALAMYIKNGIMSGKLFGLEFEPVEGLNTWLSAARFIYESGDTAAFNTFVENGGFASLANYITERSEKWFGFALTPEISQGLLLGITTNQWGYKNGSDTKTVGKTVIPSFEKAVKNWAEGRIFAWADKQLGLPAGTSYQWFDMGRQIYYSGVNYARMASAVSKGTIGALGAKDQLNLAKGLGIKGAKIVDGNVVDADGKILDIPELSKGHEKELGTYVKDQKNAVVGALKTQLLSMIATYFAEQWLGAAMRELEAKWNLVPGSLSILLDAVIGYGVTVAASSWGWIGKGAVDPNSLLIALAIFILINLFGVYKVETFYYCSADGYWPHINGEYADPGQYDVTNVGEWDAMNADVNQAKSIQAAQYKAKQLISDMLNMHNNPLFPDVYPNQIMTGRNEDVRDLNYSVTSNICSVIGMQAYNGVCGGQGATRLGLWANPQTVAWTHIGF